MTSKEIIQNEINNLKDMLKNAKELNCESIIKCSKEEIKQYSQVLKDLEILEILKKHCTMYEKVYKGKALVLDYVSKENDKKIKEWLGNDKRWEIK